MSAPQRGLNRDVLKCTSREDRSWKPADHYFIKSQFMQSLITEKSFYQYLKCPHWVYFDAHSIEQKTHHHLLHKLADDGLIAEKEWEIICDRTDVAEVTAEDLDEAFLQTMKFMRQGRQAIYHGVLLDRHYVGRPDLLEKVEGKSALGNYYYVAADIKHARELRDDFCFQGCFYAELLRRLQGVRPVQGYVITPERQVLSYLIEDFETEFTLTLDKIERVVAGQEPPHFLTSGCKPAVNSVSTPRRNLPTG